MKNVLFLFCLSVLTVEIQAQTHEFNRLYAAFRGEEGVIHLLVPGFLCRMAGSIADLEHEEKDLLRSIKSVRIMVVENPEINSQINLARIFSVVEWDAGTLPLLQIHSDDEDVIILAREKNNCVCELYVVVGGQENVMVRISGRMDRNLMKSLYDVTGIEQTKFTREI